VSIEAAAGLAHRTMRIELACARALLDAIEIIFNAPSTARSRSDVVAQIADQLSRVAITIRWWQDPQRDDEFPGGDFGRIERARLLHLRRRQHGSPPQKRAENGFLAPL
jgi:hypothetical protein